MKPTRRKQGLKRFQFSLNLTVLRHLHKGLYPKQIATKLKISSSAVSYYIQRYKKLGFLEEETYTSCKIFKVTELGKTALKRQGVQQTLDRDEDKISLGVHYTAYIPIVRRGKPPNGFWDTVNTKLNNNVQKFKRLNLIGVTVRETTKGIELHAFHRKLRGKKDIYPLISNTAHWVMGYLSRFGYELDHNYKVSDIHWTIGGQVIKPIVKKCERTTITLDKFRAKITPRDPTQQAKVWIDNTPEPNLESNDMSYVESFLMMPVMIRQNTAALNEIFKIETLHAQNVKLHMSWVKKGIKVFERFEKLLAQRRLGEFL